MVLRILEQIDEFVVEAPYVLGLAFQVWFVLTRPPAIQVDIKPLAIIVTLLAIALPFSYLKLPEIKTEFEIILVVSGFLSSLLFFWSAIYLGRSFAVLPAVRTCVTKGPYRFIRHPIYASYLVLDLVYVLAVAELSWFVVWLVEVLLLSWRALLEENLLANIDNTYKLYLGKVSNRFIPFLI